MYLTLQGQRQQDKGRQKEIIRGVLQAIYEELDSFWEQLNEEVDFYWEIFDWEMFGQRKIKHFDCRLSLSPDYITIYRSNANLIGQIEELKLRRKIVKAYMLLQSLMVGYGINTELLREYVKARNRLREAIAKRKEAEDKGDEVEARRNEIEAKGSEELLKGFCFELESYAPKLREVHYDSKKFTKELLDMLEERFSELKNEDSTDDCI